MKVTSEANIADGDCIIDINYVGVAGGTDRETYEEIRRIAELMIFQCMVRSGGVRHGGIAAGVGMSGWSATLGSS